MLLEIELMAKRYASKKTFLKEITISQGCGTPLVVPIVLEESSLPCMARGAWGLHLCYESQISHKRFMEGRMKTMH